MKAVFALALAFALLVADDSFAQTPFDGFYLGLRAGRDELKVDLDGKTQSGRDLEESRQDVGLLLGGFLGGGKALKDILYLGGEFDVAHHDVYSGYDSGSRFGLDWSFGGRFRAGLVFFDRIMAYGLLGARGAVFEYEQQYEYDHGGYSKHPVSFGAEYGGGLEFALSEHLSLRAEVSKAAYVPIVNAFYSYFGKLGDETFSPEVLDASLGLAWYF